MIKAAERKLLSFGCSRDILSLTQLDLETVLQFMADPQAGGTLAHFCREPEDREVALVVAQAALERAARLVCANLAAVIQFIGGGRDANAPVCLSLQGSAFSAPPSWPSLKHRSKPICETLWAFTSHSGRVTMPFLWGQPLPHSTAPDRSLLIVPILSGGNQCHVYSACVIEQGASQNERKSHEEKTAFFSFDPRSSLRYFHLLGLRQNAAPAGSTASQDNKEPITATLAVCGDIMSHSPQTNDAYDAATDTYSYLPCFQSVSSWIEAADYAVANFETTLNGPPYSGYPQFCAPDALAYDLKTIGFDLVTTANNHSMDKGFQGLARTLDVLDQAGLQHVGTYRTQEAFTQNNGVIVADVGGISVAFSGIHLRNQRDCSSSG